MDTIGAELKGIETLYEPTITDLKEKHKSAYIQRYQLESKIEYFRNNVAEMDVRIKDLGAVLAERDGQIEQLTSHTGYDVRRPSIGGSKIIYELGGTLRVLDLENGQTHKVDVQI
ncbi:MAG: hypothetical protein R3240_13930, partial [Gammaproteobacteria bacterium]|nr:hypothetical protein [Gammaproteobacteria bacterium]